MSDTPQPSFEVCSDCGMPAIRHDNEFDPWAEFACGSEFYGDSASQSDACHRIAELRAAMRAEEAFMQNVGYVPSSNFTATLEGTRV